MPESTRPGRARRAGVPQAFGDDEVFATYFLAELLACPIAAVAGASHNRPDARTCRRRMAVHWRDPETRPLLLLYLQRTASHRRARQAKTGRSKGNRQRRNDRRSPG
jgi:hypothetical protein